MSIVDEIKTRIDIVDLVANYVPLNKSGVNYRGLCPFHSEKTPSFFVFTDRQTWRCFGACASGGDVFSFIMAIETIDFSEALKKLADIAGIKIPAIAVACRRRSLGIQAARSRSFCCGYLTLCLSGNTGVRDSREKRGGGSR